MNNENLEKMVESFFQIFILVLAIFAFAYLLNSSDLEILPIVSAQEEQTYCCPTTNYGAICQDVTSSLASESCDNPIPASCEEVSECQTGCCIDPDEGLCAERTTRAACVSDGGIWKDDSFCNVPECRLGCCVLGSQTAFVTGDRCSKLSALGGYETDFRQQTNNELACILLSNTQEKGACILDGNSCRFGTKGECVQMGGDFYKDLLCSNPSLETNCERQKTISCIEGKDEIYWIDSCGNVENIYSSDKDASWNSGKVLTKEQSCNPNSPNADSATCGNCNFVQGSKCSVSSVIGGVKDGNFICKSVDCVDSNGNKRKNGESWCVYDSYIGDGKDPAGSRHFKEFCIDGEVRVDACADYRGQICVEDQIEIPETSETFSTASCKTNTALRCLDYNSNTDEKKIAEQCNKNPDCVLKNVDIDSDFKFTMCVPKYPTGFDLSSERGQESANTLCSFANQKCTAIYKKNLDGNWKCIANCDCEEEEFTQKMNDLCISLGDCGSYINYLGEGSDNINVKGAPQISWRDYIDYKNPVEGQHASVDNLTEYLEAVGFALGEPIIDTSGIDTATKITSMSGQIIGASGTIAKFFGATALHSPGYLKLYPTSSAFANPGFAAFANAASGIGIGMMVGSMVAKLMGVEGSGALAVTIAGAVAGGLAAVAAGTTGTVVGSVATFGGALGTAGATTAVGSTTGLGLFGGWLAAASAFAWAIIAAVVVAVIMKLLGIGKTKKVVVEFQCLPWTPPTENQKCDECNGDSSKPCTPYRCQSLGAACKIVNADSSDPICFEDNPGDSRPPVITPSKIQENFTFTEQSSNGVKISQTNGECIPEFTPVTFGLAVDEYAQCKFEFEHTTRYSDMTNFPNRGSLFLGEHNFTIMIPSLESLEVYEVSGDIRGKLGNLDMYVRCQDSHGNWNINEFVVNMCLKSGPDVTPPAIQGANPANEGFLKVGITETNATFYLNEPAQCKFDLVDKPYEEMTNLMTCRTDLEDLGYRGWECDANLGNLNDGENKFYVRCQDKPWVEDVSSRNVNQQSYEYKLTRTTNNLEIESLTPSGSVVQGEEPISIELKAQTTGGAENGKATCYYNFKEFSKDYLFRNTYSNTHTQKFDQMTEGNYDISVLCEDIAGNTAEEKTDIQIQIDRSPPVVTRVFNEGQIKVLTSEEASCYYDFNSCFFSLENGVPMTTGFSKTHTAEWISGRTYNIKCEDVFGNVADGCTIRVSLNNF